ncbi:C4-dicarboxylate-binding periplasmic protein DctP [Amylibacter marinus]|uniref:C4-dicarboxylate-binding periplasmic protein DctP n=1 Tax=Amylibacter marinus TaxID=1475483 RepID=A0ABQ5VV93_9RHOB|nr:TRAP transporter substrate-binding protein [Amylibacter marinus]GLQ35084.1 C4-dicarboxylate-binding periplasmic protein DctP [Amylibacter marinus]
MFLNKIQAATAVLALALTATAASAEIKMIMSNDNNNKGLKGQTFDYLVANLEERLGDKIDVEMHHGGTLFDQQSQIQGLQLGGAHIISPTAGIYSSVNPKVAALQLPFLLNTPEKIQAAVADPIVRDAIMPGLNNQNIEVVAVWMNGPRDLGYKGKDPILLPTDAKGLKVRVQSAPIFVKTWEAIEANPVGINWSEAPTALQQGVIDAGEVTPNSWRGSSTYQFVDHITMTDHQYSFYLVGANKQWWDSIPASEKAEINAALADATKWNMSKNTEINGAAAEFMAGEGVGIHYLSDEQRAAWAEAMKPVWQELGNGLVGDDVMNRLKEIAGVN